MTNKVSKWQKISTNTVFEKFGRKVDKVVFRLPDGSESDFYLKNELDACGVLAFTKDGKIIITRQYRPGPDEVIYDLPGGYVDAGESPEEGVKRELLEETGYSGNFQFVTACIDSSYSTQKIHCFVATDCQKIGETNLEKEEILEVELISLDQYRTILKSGECNDIEIGYLCLDYLNLLK